MKKTFSILLAFLFIFSIFANKTQRAAAAENFSDGINLENLASLIEYEHKSFQQVGGGNRVSFIEGSYNPQTDEGEYKGEQIASNYIYSRLYNFIGGEKENEGGNDNGGDAQDINDFLSAQTQNSQNQEGNVTVSITQEWFGERFSTTRTSIWNRPQEIVLYSSNIIMSFDAKDTNKKVVIGANYDNNFDGEYDGAISTGGPVAVLLALAQNLVGKELPFDIDIVFFGAGFFKGTPYHMGSRKYTQNLLGDIMLMINLSRLGGDTTYIYSDEVKNKLEDYFVGLGGLKRLPKSLPHLVGVDGPKNYPYTHYGMIGNHSKFMQEGIPAVNLFGGHYQGFYLYDSEGRADILDKDNTNNMILAYPNAYYNMAKVYQAVFTAITDIELPDIISLTQKSKFNFSIFLQEWIAYLILGAFIFIGFIVLRYKSIELLKKYPLQRVKVKPMSIFGEEYDNNNNLS